MPDDDGDPFIRNHPKPNGGTHRRFVLKSLDQLVINTAPNYLIKGLLPRVGLGVIWGWYKSGKSFSALDMALCIAHARDYHGRKTKSGPVIYIALEGGSRYPDRIKAWHMINNMPQRGAPFYLLSDVQFDLFVDSAALIATIQEQVATAPAAIFVDTLNRAIAGSENGPEDMARFVRGCDALRIAFGCFVGVIHHSGAGGNDRPRGHTSLAGADDVGIAIGRDAAGLVTLHVDHIRDDAPAADLTFGLETIQVETNDEGDPIISAAVVTVAGGRPAPKLSGYDKIAYDLLAALIAENDGSNRDIGAGEKIPSMSRLFVAGKLLQKAPGTRPGHEERAFNRTVAKLQELAIIEFYDDTVWLRDKRDVPGHPVHVPPDPRPESLPGHGTHTFRCVPVSRSAPGQAGEGNSDPPSDGVQTPSDTHPQSGDEREKRAREGDGLPPEAVIVGSAPPGERCFSCGKVLANGAGCLLGLRPSDWLIAGHPLLLGHVHPDQAGIDRKSFAANQSGRDALRHHALKYAAQCIAFAKALVPGTAKH